MIENNGWILWQLFSAIHAIAYIRCNKDDATHKKYYWTTQFNSLWFVLWLGGLDASVHILHFSCQIIISSHWQTQKKNFSVMSVVGIIRP